MYISTNPKKVTGIILLVIAFLLISNLTGIVMKYYFDHGRIFGLVKLFNFDTEKNIPTIYSSVALLFCAVLLLAISVLHKIKSESYQYWLALCALFIFLGIDEVAVIHEQLIGPVQSALNTSGALYFAWVIPYSIGVLVLFILFYRFIFSLPSHIKYLFILAGFIYITGAVGFEMIGSHHAHTHGARNVTYAYIYTVEELLEMIGVAVFIYALLSYLKLNFANTVIYLNTSVPRHRI